MKPITFWVFLSIYFVTVLSILVAICMTLAYCLGGT